MIEPFHREDEPIDVDEFQLNNTKDNNSLNLMKKAQNKKKKVKL